MGYIELETKLNMKNKIFGVKRINTDQGLKSNERCVIKVMNRIFQGEEVIFVSDSSSCRGYASNAGFKSEYPNIPGGIEYFCHADVVKAFLLESV